MVDILGKLLMTMADKVPATPTITTTGTLSTFAAYTGTPSDAQTYSVSGSNLTANIVITPPSGFELSTNGTNYYSSRTLTQSGGTVASTTVYVRLIGTEGSFSGNITHTSTDAATKNVAASGAVIPVPVGDVYYVSTTGDDDDPGTLAQPFLTIQVGMDALASGDTLYIRGGTYAEFVAISKSNITISGYPAETTILDGTTIVTEPAWSPLVTISGSNNIIQDLTITNPNGLGIWFSTASCSYDTLRRLTVHDIWGSGIYIWGSYHTLEDSLIYNACMSNEFQENGDWPAAVFVGDVNEGHTDYAPYTIVRGNTIRNNYGEGIIVGYTDNALIENNIVYDNWAANIYVDNGSYETIRNNMIYYTDDESYWRYPGDYPASGIQWANEGIISYPASHDIKIYNNIVVNAGWGILWWEGFITSAVVNCLVVNNTIVNTEGYGSAMYIDAGNGMSHSGSYIENNILATTAGPLIDASSRTGITFSDNLFSRTPAFSSSGDIVDDPLFTTGSGVDADHYTLQAGSPAIAQALVLADVTEDYFGNERDGSTPDIGAAEYV